MIFDADDGDEFAGFGHWDIDVVTIGFENHVDVGEFFTFVDWGDFERGDVDAIFTQSCGDAGEDADFVIDSKCDLEGVRLRHICGCYLVRGRYREGLGCRERCRVGPSGKHVRRDRLGRRLMLGLCGRGLRGSLFRGLRKWILSRL